MRVTQIVRAVLLTVALVVLVACGSASPKAAPTPTPTPSKSARPSAAAVAYLRMAAPGNAAIIRLNEVVNVLSPSMTTIAASCEVLSHATNRFREAIAAYNWPAPVKALAPLMERTLRSQAADAHRCFLDEGNQSAMIADLHAFFSPANHAVDTRWRKALGLPESTAADSSPTIAS